MANQGPLVRVDRGDGNLIKMTPKQAEEFVASHEGARIMPARQASEAPTEAEQAATAALTAHSAETAADGSPAASTADGEPGPDGASPPEENGQEPGDQGDEAPKGKAAAKK